MKILNFQKLRPYIIVLLVLIMIFCTYKIGTYFWESNKNKNINTDIQEIYHNNDNSIDRGEKNKFDELLSINSDVVGWVYAPNTHIDYPVVQSNNNDYYLNHNINKEKAPAGTIFMDYKNDPSLNDKNTIIYGHHMKDNSMFHDLMKYKDKDFFNNNEIIDFDTLDSHYSWQIFSIYINNDDFNYMKTNFDDDDDFMSFINEIQKRSIYTNGIEITPDDTILTLSTCTYEYENARFVIHLKRID